MDSSDLPFRELEAFARALLAILLAFLNTRIASDQSRLLQCRAKVRVEFEQCAGDSVSNGSGLARRASTFDVNQNVKLGSRFSQLQRLTDDHPQSLIGEVTIERLPVNNDIAGAGSQVHSRG